AGRLMVSGYSELDENMIVAAWLHDVMEDCGVPKGEIVSQFNREVAELVQALSNPSQMVEAYRDLPRSERKNIDNEFYRTQPEKVRVIKAYDRIDNLNDYAGAER